MNMRTTEIAKRVWQFSNDQISPSYGPLASRLQVLREYQRRLDQTCQANAVLGSCLTSDADVISDDVVDMQSEVSEIVDIYKEIDSDTFQLIDQGLSDTSNILSNASTQTTPTDFIIVDGDGVGYKFSRSTSGTDIIWNMLCYDEQENLNAYPFLHSVTNASGTKYYINNTLRSFNNSIYAKTLPSWLNSISIVSTINDITNNVVNLCVKGRASATTIYSTVSQYMNSKISSVRRWCSTFISVFNESGLSGVVNYIISSVKKIGNDVVDHNGALVFTDNKALIPQEFIGTLIATIATSIGTLLIAFGGVVAKIIGVGISIAGTLISWFGKSAWANYNSETLAGVIDSDDTGSTTVLPEAPYAMCQFEFEAADAGNSLLQMLQQNAGVAVLNVPGGYLHLGMGSDGNMLRAEFHPSVFWTFNDIQCDYFTGKASGETSQDSSYFAIPRSGLSVSDIEDKWIHGYDVGATLQISENFSSSGAQVLTEDSDKLVRTLVMRNTGLFLLWLSSIDKYYSIPIARAYHPLSNATQSSPGVGIYISDLGGTPGYMTSGTRILKPFAYALLPISGSITPRYTSSGSVASAVTVHQPTWTEIATFYTNENATKNISASAFVNVANCGASVYASYYISSGIWYPYFGDNFISKNYYSGYNTFSFAIGQAKACNTCRFIGTADIVGTSISSGIYTPKYNRETYWMWIGVVAAVTVIVATATIIASVKIKKAIKLKRAKNAARVEAAWNALTDNPNDPQAQQNYYKAAKKANLWSKVLGGTTFDTSNYWGSGSEPAEPKAGTLMNYILGNDESEVIQDQASSNMNTIASLIKY